MSNFTEVCRFNKLIGNSQGDQTVCDWTAAERQFQLINEEFTELEFAINHCDITEVRDAIADVLVTTYGLAYRLGIDADADMKIVCDSNMSKICTTADEVRLTVDHYFGMGVEVITSGELPEVVVKVSGDQTVNGKFWPDGKGLKCISWKEPRFE